MVKVLAPGFFARGDTATPLKVSLAAVALNLALNLALMRPLQVMGPPAASSLAAVFNVACLGVLLRRRGQLALDRRLLARVPRMLLASAALGLVVGLMEAHAPARIATAHLLRYLWLALLIGAGLGVYAVVGETLGAFDLRETWAALKARRARRAARRLAG